MKFLRVKEYVKLKIKILGKVNINKVINKLFF